MRTARKTVSALLIGLLAANASAEQSEEIIKVKKSTFVNLVDILVKHGVINQEEGSGLVSAAEQESVEAAAKTQPATATQSVVDVNAPPAKVDSTEAVEKDKFAAKTKHVGYVPEFVKKEIRDQLRSELKAEVVSDVKQDAKTEGWGIPGALPEWVAALHPSFDMRVRFQDNFYGSNNGTLAGLFSGLSPAPGPINFLNINSNYLLTGNAGVAGTNGALTRSPLSANYAYSNNTKDQMLLRERFRFGFEANISDSVKVGVRLATSNIYNPVSNDQSLGNTGQSYQFAIDRSYLQYDYLDDKKTSWFSAYAGRIINPFLSTDLVFDPDLSFEGVATSFRYHFKQND